MYISFYNYKPFLRSVFTHVLCLPFILLLASMLVSDQAFASKKKNKTISDWQVVCKDIKNDKNDTTKQRCVLLQTVSMAQKNVTDESVTNKSQKDSKSKTASTQIPILQTYFMYGEKGELFMCHNVYPSVLIKPGVTLMSGDKEIVSSPYYMGGSINKTMEPISKKLLKKIKKTKPDLTITVLTQQNNGDPVKLAFPFSRKGFSKGLAYIK